MSRIPLVVFGNNTFASLAWYCLTHDSPYQVVAFTVDQRFLNADTHEGLPVLPFEDLEASHPPEAAHLIIPLGYHAINSIRRDRYLEGKARGYRFASYVSSRASVWPDLQVGENTLIYEHAIIQPFARIGDNAIIRSAAHISHHCVVGDHAFVAAGVTLGGNVSIGAQSFIGVGAVLRDGLAIAERSFIGAGAVVVSDTEADGVYVGNPAKKAGRSALDVTGG
ncbi:acetyltransferase [Zoogloea sp.]|uniref:acetyltransferase n=1 Tax=Zoogloea sp. TaxID=49181 RepID=UPI0025ED1461|nr:acetyltransferase [Zoogloea sp.]MCK6392592.1 acetyltransferase [Zoogloea sp.]